MEEMVLDTTALVMINFVASLVLVVMACDSRIGGVSSIDSHGSDEEALDCARILYSSPTLVILSDVVLIIAGVTMVMLLIE
jgi:hypothetical protein